MSLRENIIEGMRVLDEDKVLENVVSAINENIDRLQIVDWLNLGMKEVGKLYESEEYYLVELIMSEIIFTSVLNLKCFKDWTGSSSGEPLGRVVLGTVNGDNHDIGKNIFKSMVEASNIKVYDLDVDVPVENFMDAIREYHPDVLALSGILTSSVDEFYKIVQRLEEEGLRDSIKILIGCPSLSDDEFLKIGADAVTSDTSKGKDICEKWIREKVQE